MKEDLKGGKFGRLTVISFNHKDDNYRNYWTCICDCGEKRIVQDSALKNGKSESCGCLSREVATKTMSDTFKTHGLSKTPTYHTWKRMRQRCSNRSNKKYYRYGGRGITVCKRWNKYENFLEDMGERPGDDLSLDRIDNDGNYEPSNCRWATQKVQQNNRGNNLSNKLRRK